MDALAIRVAEELTKSGMKIVAVNHFSGQKLFQSHNLGLELSKGLALALTKSAANIQVYENARLVKALQDINWMAIDIYDPNTFRAIAHFSGVQAMVKGTFNLSGDAVELSLMLINVSNEKKIAEFKTKLPLLNISVNLHDAPVADLATGVYLAGVGGVTVPRCKHCPEPGFSKEATQAKITKAQTLLRVTVRSDGRVADVRLLKSAGYGLDQKAAEIFQSWQMVPAHLPDGTNVSCRINIEVTFQASD